MPELIASLNKHRGSSAVRSLVELSITLAGFAGTWIALWLGLNNGYWICPLLVLPGAGFLVRLFNIQHDCGHGSFFRRKWSNDLTGRILGVFTLTPYEYWKRSHATHHATSGDLDRRGIGDIKTLTVEEYEALPRLKRLGYRLYRNPLVLFGIGPAYLFILEQRLPLGGMNKLHLWISVMSTNAAIIALYGTVVWLVGPYMFLAVHVPIVLLAASAGVWLFYVQHQFEDASWARHEDWHVHELALHGSSHYDLPPFLHWFTANIGMHHVHHLCAKIPFYRLPAALREVPQLAEIGKLSIRDSLKCPGLALWDEQRKKLISFSEYYARA